jgi:hypothetical protein
VDCSLVGYDTVYSKIWEGHNTSIFRVPVVMNYKRTFKHNSYSRNPQMAFLKLTFIFKTQNVKIQETVSLSSPKWSKLVLDQGDLSSRLFYLFVSFVQLLPFCKTD